MYRSFRIQFFKIIAYFTISLISVNFLNFPFVLFLATFLVLDIIVRSINTKLTIFPILFIGYFLVIFWKYYILNLELSYFTFNNDNSSKSKFLLFFIIFLLPIYFSNFNNRVDLLKLIPVYSLNNISFILLSIFAILLAQFSYAGNNLIESGGAYATEGFMTTTFEYTNLIFLLLILNSKYNFIQKLVLSLSLSYFIFLCVIYGTRVSILQLLFIITIRFSYKIKKIHVLFISVVTYFIMNLLEVFRRYGKFIPDTIIRNTDVQSDHHTEIIYSSLRVMGIVDSNFFSYLDRFLSFVYNILAVFTTQSLYPDTVNVSKILIDTYPSNGGLFFFVHYYFWFGLFGVFLSGIIAVFFLRGYIIKRISLLNYLGIIGFITWPRWTSYTPIMVFKFFFWYIVLFIFIFLLSNFKSLKKM